MNEEARLHLLELSIQAFWSGRLEEGRLACEWLLSNPDLPAADRELTRRNQVFYSRPLAEIAPSTRFLPVDIEVEPGWSCFNPSVAVDGERLRMIVRSSNYRLVDGSYETVDGGPVRTINHLVDLDPALGVASSRLLSDAVADSARSDFPVHGFEDCRIFRWQDTWFASATARDLNPAGICQQVLLHIGEDGFDRVWPLSNPASGYHEKNWMPLEVEGRLLFIYSVSPLVVVGFDPASGGVGIVAQAEGPEVLRAARGGSQLVRLGEGWLAIVHESVAFENGERSYPHRFVWFDGNLVPTLLSEQFHFQQRGVEYCTGLTAVDSVFIASFGAGDEAGFLAFIDQPDVVALLRPAIDTAALDVSPLLAAANEIGVPNPDDSEPLASAADVSESEQTDLVPTTRDDTAVTTQVTDYDFGSMNTGSPAGPLGIDTSDYPDGAASAVTTASPASGSRRIVSTTISGNSHDLIGDALRSVVDWVDACLLIDTGISDETIAVARQIAGDKLLVHSFPWTGSFADARNYALQAAAEAGADWSVTLDTDERLRVDPTEVLEFLDSSEAAVLHLPYEDGSYGKERFFRLPAHGQFAGPTHEAFITDGDYDVDDCPGGHFTELPKNDDALHHKFDRDIALLSRHVVDHPDDPRWRYYLGDSLQNTGRLREAIEQFQACWELNGWDEESAWAMYRAAECQIALGDLDGAVQSCANGMVRHPGIAELPWLAAWACFRMGEMRRAIAWARMSCAIGSVEGIGDSFRRIGFSNPRGQFEGPYDVLRFALRELGEDEAAEAADYLFTEALSMRGGTTDPEDM